MNKNIKTEIAIGIILLISIPVGLLFILQNRELNNETKIEEKVAISENVKKELPKEENKVFCTQDAKQCPDGSYVSRTGPNCEFAECPNDNSWKSYRNEKYGFEFSYPASYELKEDWDKSTINLSNGYYDPISVYVKDLSFDSFDDHSCLLNEDKILGELDKLSKNYENYSEDLNMKNRSLNEQAPQYLNIKKIEVDNLVALDLREADVIAGGCIFRNIFIKKENYLYIIYSGDGDYFSDTPNSEARESMDEFNEFISSFRFTN